MKMHELIQAAPILQKIAKQELSMKTLYSVSKIFQKIFDELQFYEKYRLDLLKEYCERSGDEYIPRMDTANEFDKKLEELLNLDVDLGDIAPAKIPTSEPLKLSYNELRAVSSFIEIEEE